MPLGLLAWIASDDDFPRKCTHVNSQGELPDCVQNADGTWRAVYPHSADPSAAGSGIAGLFVLALILGLAFTIWKVSTARRMARESGMDVGDATAMALLTDNGFESTYLASNLRTSAKEQPPAPEVRASTSDRLEELRGLHERGLITDNEHAEARRKILDGL